MKKRAASTLLAVCLALTWFSVARADGSGMEQGEAPALPPNLIATRDARRLLEKVWRRSPTFRLQCARISQAQWLRIKLSFTARATIPQRYRALAIVNKRDGLVTIRIFTLSDYVELIGHEFEHVVEQIEGVDLNALVAERNGAARRHEDGGIETERALNAGRKIEAEYNRAKS